MKGLILVLLAVGICAKSARAQDRNLPESGSVGLMFEIAGLGQFGLSGPVTGTTTLVPLSVPQDTIFDDLIGGIGLPVYGIGAKFYLSDRMVLRASLGVNHMTETEVFNNFDTAGNLIVTERTDDMFVGAISPGFEYHFVNAGPVSGYVGAMLSFTSSVKTTGPDSAQSSDRSSAFMVGPIIGAEFFPWDNVSLGAEYGLLYSSISNSTKVGDDVFDGPRRTTLGTGSFSVRLSLYIK